MAVDLDKLVAFALFSSFFAFPRMKEQPVSTAKIGYLKANDSSGKKQEGGHFSCSEPFFLFVCFSGETTCNKVETLTKLVFFLHSTFHITNGETALLVNWATSAFMRIIYSTLEWSIASIYTQILKLICVLKWYWLHLVLGFNSNIDWPFVMALTCGMVWSLNDVEKLLLNFLFCVHSYL